ncbi:hypothetical protein, partial [Nocardia asteroides]|uniref:hypothetical protein n=1 Tax=Nocardia asteroides TaxID=1824 RepID=UPI00365A2BC9
MRLTVIRRTALAASAAALALLVTACGSSDDGGDGSGGKASGDGKDAGGAAASAAPALTAAELEKAAQTGVPLGEPAAAVKRSWTEGPKKPSGDAGTEEAIGAAFDLDKALVTLATYDDGGAEAVLKDVKEAAGACAGGFTFTAMGEPAKIAKVAQGEAAGGADESVAMTMTMVGEDG